jgi:hypothetical protein
MLQTNEAKVANLWNVVKQATERAKAKGLLSTISTECEIIEQNGIKVQLTFSLLHQQTNKLNF